MKRLPIYVRRYIITIIIAAISLLSIMLIYYNIPNYKSLILFTILAIAVESLVVVLPRGAAVSVGYAVTFMAMIIVGPLGAALSCSLGIMLRYGKVPKLPARHILNTPFYKTLFNGCQSFISIGLTSIVYYKITETAFSDINFYTNIIPLIISICIYVLLNTMIMTKLLSMVNNQSFTTMFIKNMQWLLPNCFIVASFGIFLSILYLNYGTIIMILFFGPLLLARHSFKLYLEMKDVYIETVYALTKAVEAKDEYTDGHSKRVAEYAEKLSVKMKLRDKRVETLKTAALLHDVGKIGIKDDILNKPGKLTDEEFEAIKKHPEIGTKILSSVDFLKDAREIILKHHEKYDGSGYPSGLKDDEVPIEAYILSVADAFDAMTSDRSYRKGMTVEKALSIIKEDAGTHFHPLVAENFIELVNKEVEEQQSMNSKILNVQSTN
ncbi:HD-GYP domain-containing protein [Lachnospiraceae bacterium 50-23]